MRIASLLPSSTEIVCTLGMENQLVARSHECDFPASVRRLPPVTAPKFNPDGRSYEIDQRVKAVLQEAGSVYRINADVLKTLAPEIIITQSQCEVCAVSLEDVRRCAQEWLDFPAEVVALEPNRLSDVLRDIQRVADALAIPERGENLIHQLTACMQEITERTAAITARPTVATIEWIQPLMCAGNWMPELVEMAGGTNLFGTAGEHSAWMMWEDIRAADPDVLAILPCGFDIATTLREMPLLTANPGWHDLRAVRNNRVFVTDGNQYFNRPGPRLLDSLEILAEITHPDTFHFGHEGDGWINYRVNEQVQA